MGWKPAERIAVALFNFDAQNDLQLPLKVGDLVYILEEAPDWYRGYLYQQPSKRGIFPASFVHIKDHSTSKRGTRTFTIPAEDEVALEAKESLREWWGKLLEFYVNGPREKYGQLLHSMEEVLAWRRNILHSSATHDALQTMKMKLTAKLDAVNSRLGCPLSPRNQQGKVVDSHHTSVQEFFRLHQDRSHEIEQAVPHTGALQRKTSEAPNSQVHHLYLRVDYVDHSFPEDAEVFFFLTDPDRKGHLTERFVMERRKAAERSTFHEQEKHIAVFTDLGSRDLQATNLYLTCQIIRKGKMLLDDRKNTSAHQFRRPYACGVLDVTSLLGKTEDSDEDDAITTFTMPLYLCSTNHESDFATFHTNVIKKLGARGGQKPGCAITLTLRGLHGDLGQLRRDFPFLFSKTTDIVHKFGFPDIILPGDVRNDVYVTLEHGVFEKGTKRAERNVQVAIDVVDNHGSTIQNAITVGAGAKPVSEYESFVFYHNNTPKWNETFKLSIPLERLHDAHLRIAFRHVAKNESKEKAEKTFAFTYLRVMKEDGSIIHDGSHELYVYKAEGKRWFDPKIYLSQASCKDDVISQRSQRTMAAGGKALQSVGGQISRSFREMIQLSTLTCSTKLTQKIDLLLLLKWRQREKDLSVVLTNLARIDGEEVVKFLQDTLDCLFDILNTNPEKYGELVFDALVHVFGLMSDDKYRNFNTVLDIYIQKHFSAILAYKFLMWSFKKHVAEGGERPERHTKVICVLRSMRYVFRFTVQSYTLYVRHNKRDDPTFRSSVTQLFDSLCRLMGIQENIVKGIHLVQSTLLLNLATILPEIEHIFSELELAVLISNLLDSIRTSYGSIPGDKLTFILNVLNGPVNVLRSEASRRRLVPTLVAHLTSHIGHRMSASYYKPKDRANRDTLECVGKLQECLHNPELGTGFMDIDAVVPLILPLLHLCREIPRNNPLALLSLVNFIGLLDMMEDEHFALLFASQKSTLDNALKDFVMDLMAVLKQTIEHPPYPKDWATLYFVQSRVISRALQNTSKALLDGFLNNTDFNPQIWDHFFLLCTSFLTQDCLQLENFSDFRRHRFRQQFGDMRLEVGKYVVLMWHKLQDKKGNFIPNLIGPFLEITLVKQRELRRVSLPLVCDVMRCEQIASGNFKRVETEVFDKIDNMVAEGHGDEEYKEMFHDILKHQCSVSRELELSGSVFIDSVSRLIALLLDYRNVSTDECYKGRRMGCMLNLLNFYNEIEKEELYIRYIYKLAQLHEKDHSFTEAAFTLMLHAKGLEWSSTEMVHAVQEWKYPAQPKRDRKERLYLDAIRLFDQGKSWECGIPLCKELATIYETELFDYQKLASTLQRQAEFFQKIIRELRVECEYFMVGYYGRGFPLFLRNKIFIHRGQPYERLGSFIKRLTDEFSTAQILKTTGPPDSDTQNSSGMYFQIRSVHPIPELEEVFKGKRVPDKIAEYYKTNGVRKFRYDRPFHKGEKDPECEFATLWIERTAFTTAESFPGVISWFEVSTSDTVQLNPLDIALETVGSKNRDIQAMVGQYSEDKTLNINPLSMLLNGVIDAAVMGGISNYGKIFFNTSYETAHPDHAEGVMKLKKLIEDQATILEKALALHGQRITQNLQGLHAKLESCFEEFQGMVFPEKKKALLQAKARLHYRTTTIDRPLPPTPLEAQKGGGSPPLNKKSKVPTRRSTGMPSKVKQQVSLGGEAEPQKRLPKRSSTTKSIIRLNPPSPTAKKRLSTSLSESVPEGSSLTGSRQSSTTSVNRFSEEEEEEDRPGGDYERVDDFLSQMMPQPPFTPSPSTSLPAPTITYPAPPPNYPTPSPSHPVPPPTYPMPSPSLPTPIPSHPAPPPSHPNPPPSHPAPPPSHPAPPPSHPIPPPSYPAPPPSHPTPPPSYPAPPPPDLAEEDEEDASGHDYEPVLLNPPESPPFSDEVERDTLPYFPAAMRVGMKREPKRTTSESLLSSEKSPSKSDSERSPGSPERGLAPTASKQWEWVKTRQGKVLIPPEPTTPPPSPPQGTFSPPRRRQISPVSPPSPAQTQPPVDEGVYAFDQLSKLPEQPKLPQKQRKASKPLVESEPQTLDDGVYVFDTLTPQKHSPKLPPKIRRQSKPQPQESDDGVYTFDTLEPTQLPPKQRKQHNEPQIQPSESDDGVYSFDALEPVNFPPKQRSQQPEKPQATESDDGVYSFDSLEPSQPPKPSGVIPAPEGVYEKLEFDHLSTKKVEPPRPIDRDLSRKKTPPPRPQPYSHESTPEAANPPPIPIKRSKTLRQNSNYESSLPRTELPPAIPEGEPEKPKPVPRPRGNTLDRQRLHSSDTPSPVTPVPTPRLPPVLSHTDSAPLIPPKPSVPMLPPKPGRPPVPQREQDGTTAPPPRPQKPQNWRSKR